MKSKHWLFLFFILLLLGTGSFMFLNFTVDPMGYFTNVKNESRYNSSEYTRAIKSDYVVRNKDTIDAVILGGSKAGVLDPELFSSYTGKHYYNFYNNVGNFSDYLTYGKFLIDNTNISEITLHLSCFEVEAYDLSDSEAAINKVPAIVKGGLWNKITEVCNFLMTDIQTTLEAIKKADYTPTAYNDTATGMRHWIKGEKAYAKDPDAYVTKYCLNDLHSHLVSMFHQKAEDNPAYDDNIKALQELKDYCDEHGVTLKVFIGASFIGERSSYECERYYYYLRQIVNITEVWDFSDFSEINLNPYNFINREHFNPTVANLMVDTMYGGNSVEGFGTYLTPDNIDDYLTKRKADLERLRAEFKENGALDLPGASDPSFLQ